MSAAETKLKKAKTQNSMVKAELDMELKKCASALEKTRTDLEERRESYWKDSLLAEPEERMKWTIEFDAENRIHPIPPDDLVANERMFEKAKYPRKLVKRLDLDARFQVRVAVIFRSYLRQDYGISLKTISRLTLLTYICGDIGKEQSDGVLVDRRKITVGAVDQKIRAESMK